MSFHEIIIYFQGGPVFISNERAVFGPKTYLLSDIHSVSGVEQPPNRSVGLLVALIGLLIACVSGFFQLFELMNIDDQSRAMLGHDFDLADFILMGGAAVLFLFIVAVGVISAASERPTYIVSIKNASGFIKVFASKDRACVVEIINAMNQAIADRKNQPLWAPDHIYI